MLTIPPFNPAPAESLNYLPASFASQQHTIADGPYQVQTYVPDRKIVLVRNPAWQASSDPIRKAYMDQINVSGTGGVLETGSSPMILQILETNAVNPQTTLGWTVRGPVHHACARGVVRVMFRRVPVAIPLPVALLCTTDPASSRWTDATRAGACGARNGCSAWLPLAPYRRRLIKTTA
jgi:hypothetical protein